MKNILAFLLLSSLAFFSVAQKIELVQNFGHNDYITDIVVSPNNKYLLSTDWGGTAKLWDKELAKEIRTFNSKSIHVFASDSKSFFAIQDKQVIQWSLETGDKIATFDGSKSQIVAIAANSVGDKLIAGNKKGEILIFSIDSKKLIKTLPPKVKVDNEYRFAIDPNNNSVVYGDFYTDVVYKPEVWDFETEKKMFSLNTEGTYYKVSFSGNAKYLIAGICKGIYMNNRDQYLQVFDLKTGTLVAETSTFTETPKEDGMFYFTTFDADNNRIVFSSSTQVRAFDLKSKAITVLHKSYPGIYSTYPINNTYFCINSSYLFTIEPETGSILKKYYSLSDYVSASQLSNNKSIIAIGAAKEIKLFNLENGKKVNTINGNFNNLSNLFFNANDTRIAVVYGSHYTQDTLVVKIFDIASGREIKSFKKYTAGPNSFAMNSSLTEILVNYGELKWGKVECYSIETGSLIFAKTDFDRCVTSSCYIDNDSRILVSAGKSCSIINTSSGAEVKSFSLANYNGIESKSFDNKPEILSFSSKGYSGELILWNYKTGKTIKRIDGLGYPGHISALSPDNSTIVSFTKSSKVYNVKNIDIWDVATGKRKGSIEFNSRCNDIFFSKNGDKLFTVSDIGEIGVWDTKSFNKTCALATIKGAGWVSYTPNGQFDGNQEGISYLHFVQGLSIIPLESLYEQYYTPNLYERILGGDSPWGAVVEVKKLMPSPEVKIVTPVNQSNITVQTITVSVKATDQGGGIDEVRLYHNGKLLDGTIRGFKSIGQNHEFTVMLTNGENRIKATAFNSQRTESIPDEIVVHYKTPEIVKPNMHILAIGINNYLNPKYNLNYAKNDADAFVKSLSAGASSLFGKVEVTTINDANATKTGILAAIEKIKSTSKAEDVFVFYYAGHGVMSGGNSVEKPMFYLVPHDVTKMYEADEMLKKSGISATEMSEFSKTIKAQKQLFVLDACQSGGAMQTLAMRGASEEKAIAQLARSTGTYFIAASGSEQFATEVATLGHGIFTYSVIEALKGSCKALDGKVTVNLLKTCVEDLVPELSKKYKGQPQFPTGYGFGMDFPIGIIK